MNKRLMDWAVATGMLATAAACLPAPAAAFVDVEYYYRSAAQGGGGGRFFTGSPADGYTCNVCHRNGPRFPFQVEGLPADGYVAGAEYELTVSWPEFTAYDDATRLQGLPNTSMGLVLELVAESGRSSGSLSLAQKADAPAEENCLEGLNLGRASRMFGIRSDEPVEPDLRICSTVNPGDRCVVHVPHCRARKLAVAWRAPDANEGAVWFAAAMVTSTAASADPDGDGVYTELVALQPANSASESYVAELVGHCGTHRPGARSGAALVGLLLLVLGLRRNRSGREGRC